MGRSNPVTKGPRGIPRVAYLLVSLLGVFFLAYPTTILLRPDPTPARAFLALACAALFADVFLGLTWTREPLQLAPARPPEVPRAMMTRMPNRPAKCPA